MEEASIHAIEDVYRRHYRRFLRVALALSGGWLRALGRARVPRGGVGVVVDWDVDGRAVGEEDLQRDVVGRGVGAREKAKVQRVFS